MFFEFNLEGRVRNYDLPPNKFLDPLYEAVINALQSLDQSPEPNGYIDIHILKDDNQGSISLLCNEEMIDLLKYFYLLGIYFESRIFCQFNSFHFSLLTIYRHANNICVP